jgi:glycerol-3-phosphate acyltransferase PlsY
MDAWAYHNPVLALLAVAILGYLLGSIPFGVLLTRAAGVGDVRNIGSGNIGATNVLRTGRRDLALATLVLDGGKAALAIAITLYLFMDLAEVRTLEAVAGASAFLGHLFPVWLGFKGGKGVATFFGALLVAAWPVGVAAAMTWMTVAFLLRRSSLAALVAAALSPFLAAGLDQPAPIQAMAAFMAVLIFVRHRENIGRLLNGTEPRIGKATAPSSETPSP